MTTGIIVMNYDRLGRCAYRDRSIGVVTIGIAWMDGDRIDFEPKHFLEVTQVKVGDN